MCLITVTCNRVLFVNNQHVQKSARELDLGQVKGCVFVYQSVLTVHLLLFLETTFVYPVSIHCLFSFPRYSTNYALGSLALLTSAIHPNCACLVFPDRPDQPHVVVLSDVIPPPDPGWRASVRNVFSLLLCRLQPPCRCSGWNPVVVVFDQQYLNQHGRPQFRTQRHPTRKCRFTGKEIDFRKCS